MGDQQGKVVKVGYEIVGLAGGPRARGNSVAAVDSRLRGNDGEGLLIPAASVSG